MIEKYNLIKRDNNEFNDEEEWDYVENEEIVEDTGFRCGWRAWI